MKIGIVGGTFDPIHNGHLMLGAYAYDNFQLDEVWFMPNGNPPHKSEEINIDFRLDMVKLAIEDNNKFFLSTFEMEEKHHSYSYETLEKLQEIYPENTFYFIIGADSLFTIEFWKEPARVFQACIILAACREDKEMNEMNTQISYLTEKYDAKIKLLKMPLINISSTDIRKKCEKGESIDALVPKKVLNYIKTHQLYEGK
ncbi:nicotinate-nucleotide adenylyltransferase [Faecalimonas sp.]